MAKVSAVIAVGLASTALLSVLACSKDPPPPQQPAASAQPYTPPPADPAPMATGTAPVPGQMATPGPTALACQNDSMCMTHRCNLQYGKCAFPCQSDADCIQGATCFVAGGPAAACLPKPPGAQ